MSRELIFHASALLLTAALAMIAISFPVDIFSSGLLLFTSSLAIIFGLYGLLLWSASKLNFGIQHHSAILLVAGLAIVLRVLFLVNSNHYAPLSDDVYRYVWEGKEVALGYNPYSLSPSMMSNSGLADASIFPRINHPELPSIYPPLAQYLFALSWLAGGDSLIGFRTISFLFELVSLFLIFALIREYRLPVWRSLIYVCSPLLLIEFAYSSHVDILALPFLIGLLISIRRGNPLFTGLLLALAVLVKLIAIIFLPLLLFYFKGKDRFSLLATFTLVVFLLYLPFLLTAGLDVLGSLWTYMGNWEHNGSIFLLLKLILGAPIARIIVGLLFFTAIIIIARDTTAPMHPVRLGRHDPQFRVMKGMLWTVAAWLLLGTTVYPWYLIWLLPFLVIHPVTALLLFTGMIFLSYDSLLWPEGIRNTISLPIRTLIEYIPVYLLILYKPMRILFHNPKLSTKAI